ncbi:hypothetical protein [Rubrobacter tropicus]|nr:hypothetical protein [Rubrobacter tropicus]
MRKRAVALLAALTLGVAGCGEANAPERQDEPPRERRRPCPPVS